MGEVQDIDVAVQKRRRRFEQLAYEIAGRIDPKAGGFFRRCLERAALAGMEAADKEAADENP